MIKSILYLAASLVAITSIASAVNVLGGKGAPEICRSR
jgi:hypothetical protein